MSVITDNGLPFTGWWWRSDYPEDRVPGIAYIAENRSLHIELLSSFKDGINRDELSMEMRIDTLYGQDGLNGFKRSEADIFAFDVTYKERFKPSVERPSVVRSPRYLLGAPGIVEPTVIREMLIEVEGLYAWINEYDNLPIDFESDELSVTIPPDKQYEDLSFELPDCNIQVVDFNEGSMSVGSSVNYEARSYFKVISNVGLTHIRALNIVRHLQDFVSLVCNRDVHLLSLKAGDAIYSEEKRETWNRMGQFHDLSCRFVERNEALKLNWPDMLFTLEEIRPNFPQILVKWFQAKEYNHMVFDSYFSVERAKFLYLESRFLSYVRGIEAHYRHKVPDSRYVDQSEFDSWVDGQFSHELKTKFPGGGRNKSLRRNIRHNLKTMGNRWSLEEVLRTVESWRTPELVNRLLSNVTSHGAVELEESSGKAEDFIARIARTRNRLSHGLGLDPKCLDRGTPEFFQANSYLRILLQAGLLELVGLSHDRIDELLLAHYKRPL